MKITLSNKIKIKDPPESLKNALINILKLKNPKFMEAEKLNKSTFKIDEYIHNFEFNSNNDLLIPRGMRDKLFELNSQFGYNIEVEDKRTLNTDIGYIDGSKIIYRAYQKEPIEKMLSGGPEGVLVAPPGSGKTVMGMSLIPILLQSSLWLTHTDRLLKQSYERCREFLPELTDDDIGIIGGGKWKIGRVITIGMIQTLIRNLNKLYHLRNTFGLVIIDEAHHCPASTFLKVISTLNPYFLYGLTATAYRRDGLESMLFQSIGPIRAELTKEEIAFHKGIIPPLILYCPISFGEIVNINSIPKIFKDNIIYNSKRNLRIKDDIVREAKAGNFCIVASGRKIHCDILYEMIKKEWKHVGIATGNYSKKKIDSQVEAFNNKEITVLVTTPDLLGEGFDVDFLNRLFIVTSFRTESRAEQLIGRIQRYHEDKENAIVYDYVDENIGVLQNQFYSKYGKCRSNVYNKLGLKMIHYNDYRFKN